MTVVYVDSAMPDDERRSRLFAGDLFVYSATPSSQELCEFAQQMAVAAFAPYHPTEAQHHLEPHRYVEILGSLKPQFINHPRCKELLPRILAELGADPELTYFDVPRLRTMTSEYLNAGLTLQFDPHRDTWFSAPMGQVNWWMPVYEVAETNVMTFYPRHFTEPVQNTSRQYDYARWVAHGRAAAATQVEKETRPQPHLEQQIDTGADLRVITPPGGLLLFSGAQLHATVPNTAGRTRFSIDFRTVHRHNAERRQGAANIDSECSGTTLGDFLRATDLAPLPAALIDSYQTVPA